MEFKPVRRVVVGHDAHGKAVALFDGPVVPKQRSPGGNAVINLWVTSEFPVDLSGVADKAATQVGVPPPANGTIFRIVDFPPHRRLPRLRASTTIKFSSRWELIPRRRATHGMPIPTALKASTMQLCWMVKSTC